MRKQLLISALLLVLFLLACAPKASPTAPQVPAPVAPAPVVPAPAAAPAQAAPARPAWEMEWEKTLDAARKEATLIAATQFGPGLRRAVGEAFKSRFRIGIDWLSGTSSELGVKILTERRAGIHSVDVGTIGHITTYNVLKPAGVLESLDKVLFLPELTDPQEIRKVWRFGELEWVDKEHTILVFMIYQSNPLAINTQLVKPGEIKGYRDLLNPKWKGKMVIYDPTIGSGAGTTWATITGSRTMGWDYLRQVVEQEPIITRDGRLQTEWLARGKVAIAIAVNYDIYKEFVDIGAPLQLVLPEEGSYTAAGGNTIILLKSAPHLNSAKLFVNWLLSKEAQTVYSKANGLPSGRLDVSVEGIDPLLLPDPKMRYDRSYSAEVIEGTTEAVKMSREVFGKLKR